MTARTRRTAQVMRGNAMTNLTGWRARTCPRCGAQPGQPCRRLHAVDDGEWHKKEPHRERRQTPATSENDSGPRVPATR